MLSIRFCRVSGRRESSDAASRHGGRALTFPSSRRRCATKSRDGRLQAEDERIRDAAGVGAHEDTARLCASGEQPGDRRFAVAEDACLRVDPETGEAERDRRNHLDDGVGRFGQRSDVINRVPEL